MDFLSTIEWSSLFFFSLFFIIFQNLTKYIICKDSPFETASAQLPGKTGGGLPYLKLNSVGSIPRFRRLYS